jgi:phosphatidate cytidylyltransferase
MNFSETTTRILVAAVGIPIAAVVIVAGGWPLALLLSVISIVAALEFYRLAEAKGVRPLRWPGVIVAALFPLVAGLNPSGGPEESGFTTLIVLALLTFSVIAIWGRKPQGQPTLAMSATLTGALYTGLLLTFGLFLRHLPDTDGRTHGAALVFAPLLLTWASDTFAYFVGRQWGTRKLIPSVSPGKTVQGAIGALVGAVLVAVIYNEAVLDGFSTYRMQLWEAAFFGLLISVTAQLGDLAESLFKRDAGVKDSGRFLPGHGGALDRFDSLLFTLPVGFYFLYHHIGPYHAF